MSQNLLSAAEMDWRLKGRVKLEIVEMVLYKMLNDKCHHTKQELYSLKVMQKMRSLKFQHENYKHVTLTMR